MNFGPGFVDNGTSMRQSFASFGELIVGSWRRVVAGAKAPVATLGLRTHVVAETVVPTYSLRDMVADLNQNGFPVSLIAELVNVEHKTVYNWINETATFHRETEDRVASVYPVLKKAFDRNFAIMRRVWRTKSREGDSLESICTSKTIDVAKLEKHLASTAASIARNAVHDGRGKHEDAGEVPAFGEHPVWTLTYSDLIRRREMVRGDQEYRNSGRRGPSRYSPPVGCRTVFTSNDLSAFLMR
jgi:hypothetical protein